jgi:hypothetical protein
MTRAEEEFSDRLHRTFLGVRKLVRSKSRIKRDAMFFYGGFMAAVEISKTHKVTAIRTKTGQEIPLR